MSTGQSVGRNDPCPCGSGKKYKKCCLLKGMHNLQSADKNQIDTLQQLFANGDYAQAVSLGESLLAQHAGNADILHFLGLAKFNLGETETGLEYVEKSIRLAVNDPVFHCNYGLLLQIQNRTEQAVDEYIKALALDPDNVDAIFNYANLLFQRNQANRARKILSPAITKHGDDIELSELYAQVLFAAERWAEAAEAFEKLCQLKPDKLQHKLAHCLSLKYSAGLEAAEKCYLECIDRFAGDTQAYEAIILFYESQNNLPQARHWLNRARSVENVNQTDMTLLEARLRYSAKEYTAAQNRIDKIDIKKLGEENQQHYYYEAARIYDKNKNYKTAFELAEKANELKAKKRGIKDTENADQVKTARRYYEKARAVYVEKSQQLSKSGLSLTPLASTPIFIVGFPRSGTTLVEQILSSHKNIASGGELNFIPFIQDEVASESGQENIVDTLAGLPGVTDLVRTINDLRERYIQAADTSSFIDMNKKWFTDKRLFNAHEAGFLSLVFPESPIIHVVRHPLDTCLSCYFTDFTTSHAFIHYFKNLASKYNQMHEEIDKDRASLALNYFQLKYENLVEKPEAHIRELLNFIGEDWDASCLAFHQNKRVAMTASHAQVNQQLYTSAMSRYKPYLPWLDELVSGLAPSIDALGYSV